MGDPVILREEDVGRIVEYAKPWLRELVDQLVPRLEFAGVGSKLLERMVRVEEELRTQRDLMDERFGFMERRFEAVDKRFEAVNQRFADLSHQMNHRFTTLTWMIGVGFVVITSLTTVFALLA